MPQFFAARPFTLPSGQAVDIGDEVPEVADWGVRLEAYVATGHIIAACGVDEVKALLQARGGATDWLTDNSLAIAKAHNLGQLTITVSEPEPAPEPEKPKTAVRKSTAKR